MNKVDMIVIIAKILNVNHKLNNLIRLGRGHGKVVGEGFG